MKPNIATLYASLTADGVTASDALNNINNQLSSILTSLQNSGVSQNDITTSSVGLYPKYNYTNGTSVVVGYTVYVSLTVIIRGIDTNSQKIAKVIDTLASNGATSIYGLSYDTQDPSAGKSVARINAWNDALTKAKQYAQLAGRKPGKVLLIEETSASYNPYYYGTANNTSTPLMSAGAAADASAASPQLPVGYILIQVIVIVTWELL